jgi:glutamate synthase (NADPH/NADH) large chain
MMGAEEFGIGTAALIAMGCIMVRQCQSNTCPVGVCTQDEKLREKFTGTADKVVNLITFYAQELREQLAAMGARSLDEVIGRADLLTQVSRGAAHLDDLDLNPLLITVDGAAGARYDRTRPRTEVPDTLDAEILHDAEPFFRDGEKMQLSYTVRNTHRTIGTRVSSHIVRRFGMRERPAARPSDGEADRLGRPVAGRLCRARAEADRVGRCQRLCRQGAVGRHGRGAAGTRKPA